MSISRLMGEASAMGVFLQEGIGSWMLRPYERSDMKETSYLLEEKPFDFFLKLVRNAPNQHCFLL
ncbi:MAG: hypothetical protein BGO78_10860 [Chloroflexi bacterium 44-23]|nr:MAG: hypothetical protein BGO78_10860 [Chloroflexi bacterium 44-23]